MSGPPSAAAEPSAGANAAAAAFERQRAAMAVLDTTGPEKAILLVLSIMANADGEAWPPVRGPNGLAAKSSLGDRTVARALRRLEALGHITTRHVIGKGSIYAVHPCHSGRGVRAAPLPQRQATPAAVAPKQPRTTIPQKATPSSVRTRQASAADQLSLLDDPSDLPPGVTPERWREFDEMRRSMARGSRPRPWTDGARRGIIRDLQRIRDEGGDPEAALHASIVNGWQGVRFSEGTGHGQRHRAGGGQRRPDTADAILAARDRFGAD